MFSTVTIEHAAYNRFLVHASINGINYLIKHKNGYFCGLLPTVDWKIWKVDDKEFDVIPSSCKQWNDTCFASRHEYTLTVETVLLIMNFTEDEFILSSCMMFDTIACDTIMAHLIHNTTIKQFFVGGGIHPKNIRLVELFRQNKTLISLRGYPRIDIWGWQQYQGIIPMISKSQLSINCDEINYQVFLWRVGMVKEVVEMLLNNSVSSLTEDHIHCIEKILQYKVDKHSNNHIQLDIKDTQQIYGDRLRALI